LEKQVRGTIPSISGPFILTEWKLSENATDQVQERGFAVR